MNYCAHDNVRGGLVLKQYLQTRFANQWKVGVAFRLAISPGKGIILDNFGIIRNRPVRASLLFALVCLAATPCLAGEVVLRGRAYCVDASGRLLGDRERCDPQTVRFVFKTATGKAYDFLPTDLSTAIFTDSRVRARELQLTANLYPEDRLEIIKVQSIREEKLYDLYYFCEVCNITAYAPGPCTCCREEMEFRETPARDQ